MYSRVYLGMCVYIYILQQRHLTGELFSCFGGFYQLPVPKRVFLFVNLKTKQILSANVLFSSALLA